VHHINFNPEACCDDSEREFIVLCRSCHANTTNSSDRSETARYYSIELHKRTGGKCWYTKEEIRDLQIVFEGLEKRNRWDLSHLCYSSIQRTFVGEEMHIALNPLLPD
jgi:hypothetical protein